MAQIQPEAQQAKSNLNGRGRGEKEVAHINAAQAEQTSRNQLDVLRPRSTGERCRKAATRAGGYGRMESEAMDMAEQQAKRSRNPASFKSDHSQLQPCPSGIVQTGPSAQVKRGSLSLLSKR